jgi:hypothetical protein
MMKLLVKMKDGELDSFSFTTKSNDWKRNYVIEFLTFLMSLLGYLIWMLVNLKLFPIPFFM